MVNRIMTTRQKKFLEKTLCCLGISIDELIDINNLSSYKGQIKEQAERIDLLEKAVIQSNEVISHLTNQVAELIANQQKSAYEQIFRGFGEQYAEGVDNR